jgi:hypothetical protein
MSVENVFAFFEKVEQNKELQDLLRELSQKELESEDMVLDEVIKIATAEGHEFTPEEFEEARKEPEELSNDKPSIRESHPCAGYVAWRDNPPPEGCFALAGCGYQHPNFLYPGTCNESAW